MLIRTESNRSFYTACLTRLLPRIEWDEVTGKPLPETLRRLGLGDTMKDLWQGG